MALDLVGLARGHRGYRGDHAGGEGEGPHDFLSQGNLAYAAALRAAKVPLTFREFPTLNHGFFSYTAISPVCAEAAEQICRDLGDLLSRS